RVHARSCRGKGTGSPTTAATRCGGPATVRKIVRIDRTAAKGFSAGADAYQRARPAYAADAVARLAERLRIGASSRVVDLGAGTGRLTAQLVPTGAELIAIEPVVEMRAHLRSALPA